MKFSKFLSSNWVITLTATTVGVLLALLLNKRVETQNIRAQVNLANEKILQEIGSNKESLNNIIVDHRRLYDILEFLHKYKNEDEKLVGTPEDINSLRNKYPGILVIKDSTAIDDTEYVYRGAIESNFSLPHINLSSFSMEALKGSGFAFNYDFDCLIYLEQVDEMTKDIFQRNKELLGFFSGGLMGENPEILLTKLKLLVEFEEGLQDLYSLADEKLAHCS